MSFPWQRYDGTYTSGWDNPKKAAKKAAAKKTAAKPARKRKPKKG